jgi:hypothetical protein
MFISVSVTFLHGCEYSFCITSEPQCPFRADFLPFCAVENSAIMWYHVKNCMDSPNSMWIELHFMPIKTNSVDQSPDP